MGKFSFREGDANFWQFFFLSRKEINLPLGLKERVRLLVPDQPIIILKSSFLKLWIITTIFIKASKWHITSKDMNLGREDNNCSAQQPEITPIRKCFALLYSKYSQIVLCENRDNWYFFTLMVWYIDLGMTFIIDVYSWAIIVYLQQVGSQISKKIWVLFSYTCHLFLLCFIE